MQYGINSIFYSLFLLANLAVTELAAQKIGLCITATGRYDAYAQKLIESARKYFCVEDEVTFFVFTDGQIELAPDIVIIYQQRLGWPDDTLKRFSFYAQQQKLLQEMDYVFATDADMLFVDYVGNEILGERVATQHPGFVNKRGTYETNSLSKACITAREGKYYFAGGFYGGSALEFIKLVETLAHNIEIDEAHNFIAVWHDESHLNRYFIDHKPTKILSPAYCYPESWKLPYKKRLLALDKNHAEMRKD